MINPLAPFLAYLARKRSERAMRSAERRRAAIIAQIADRKQHKREWKPLRGLLAHSTNASLAAGCGRKWPVL